eukprot:COSAG01_NODE_829_length_13273_cov_7.729695_14_plen_89_part_00
MPDFSIHITGIESKRIDSDSNLDNYSNRFCIQSWLMSRKLDGQAFDQPHNFAVNLAQPQSKAYRRISVVLLYVHCIPPVVMLPRHCSH